MTDLSPAAQAIKDAVLALYADEMVHKFGWQLDAPTVAAALRAAADQVVPEQALEDVPGRFVKGCCHARLQDTRAELLAIAAELEQAASNNITEKP
jgi:hypothetical protein